LLDSLDSERRSFLKCAFAATSGAAALTTGALLSSPAAAQTVAARQLVELAGGTSDPSTNGNTSGKPGVVASNGSAASGDQGLDLAVPMSSQFCGREGPPPGSAGAVGASAASCWLLQILHGVVHERGLRDVALRAAALAEKDPLAGERGSKSRSGGPRSPERAG